MDSSKYSIYSPVGKNYFLWKGIQLVLKRFGLDFQNSNLFTLHLSVEISSFFSTWFLIYILRTSSWWVIQLLYVIDGWSCTDKFFSNIIGVVNVLSNILIFFRAKLSILGNFQLRQFKSSNFDHPKTRKINKNIFFHFLPRTNPTHVKEPL